MSGGLGIVCMETFWTMMCSVEVWMLLSTWAANGESGTVTTDCSGESERGP